MISTIMFALMCSLSARQIVAGPLWPLKVGTQCIVQVLVCTWVYFHAEPDSDCSGKYDAKDHTKYVGSSR